MHLGQSFRFTNKTSAFHPASSISISDLSSLDTTKAHILIYIRQTITKITSTKPCCWSYLQKEKQAAKNALSSLAQPFGNETKSILFLRTLKYIIMEPKIGGLKSLEDNFLFHLSDFLVHVNFQGCKDFRILSRYYPGWFVGHLYTIWTCLPCYQQMFPVLGEQAYSISIHQPESSCRFGPLKVEGWYWGLEVLTSNSSHLTSSKLPPRCRKCENWHGAFTNRQQLQRKIPRILVHKKALASLVDEPPSKKMHRMLFRHHLHQNFRKHIEIWDDGEEGDQYRDQTNSFCGWCWLHVQIDLQRHTYTVYTTILNILFGEL